MDNVNNIRLLFGAFGKDAVYYSKLVSDIGIHCRRIDDQFFVYNRNTGGLTLPEVLSADHKHLILNGLFMLGGHTLDDMMSDGRGILISLLKNASHSIPRNLTNGAYVGVVYERKTLHVFNDFMGLLPLYYGLYNGTLLFSTNLTLMARILKASWDETAVSEFMHLGSILSHRTLLKGISNLSPASVLKCENGGITVQQYASYPDRDDLRPQQEDIVNEIRFEFSRAIRRIHSTTMKYCLSLTGGMDSRMIFLEWPDRAKLLTETAGAETSDYLKAQALVAKYGNADLHELECKHEDKYVDGIIKYYDLCDNPTRLATHYNFYHLKWKHDRGADIHLTGVGGELLDGESLYLSRKYSYVLREAFLPYRYNPLSVDQKPDLINAVLYAGYKKDIADIVNPDLAKYRIDFARDITDELDDFLGHPSYAETFVERFRTYVLANAAFYPLSFVGAKDFHVFPFNDRLFMKCVSQYHPSVRELRRLSFKILSDYPLAQEIPVDTTHLKVYYPYQIQKLFRVLRMVLNIGFHKKVPVIQNGNPPSFRRPKYFDHEMVDYRAYVRSLILQCSFYDAALARSYIDRVEGLTRSDFFTMHREAANISILLRLAIAEQKFK